MIRSAAVLSEIMPRLTVGLIVSTIFSLPTYSATPAATTTTLSITESGQAVTAVPQGSLLTLTATVTSGAGAVTAGQVNFCNVTASLCSDIHLLGTAQLTSTGTAVMKMRAAPGQHSYKAVFLGAPNAPTAVATSSSSPWSLFVQPSSISTASALSISGADPYTMICTVSGPAPNSIAGPTGTITFTDLEANSVLGTGTLGSPAQTRTFLGHVDYPTGSGPLAVEYGDFNGDGVLDLVIANQASNSISVLLGNTDGTFQSQTTYSFSSYPLGLAVGDFNGDNKLDLAIPNYGANSVTILLGNGDGTFTRAATAPATGSGPAGIIAGDFNQDGKLDLVVTNAGGGTISVLLGNGDGTFQAQKSYPVGTQPIGIASGLFNGIGNPLDLVVANYGGGTLSVLAGNGDGTFQAQQVLTNGISSNPNVLAADFNGDGSIDIAAAGNGWASVLLGNGNGTFQPALVTQTGIYAGGIAVGDLNGDGVPEIAIPDNHGSSVLLLYNQGNGTMTVGPSYAVGTTGYGITAGDFNADGLTDLAVGDGHDGKVSILLNHVSTSGQATIQNVTVIAGANPTHALQCSYPGDVNYAPSVSLPISKTVTPATPILVVSPVTITYGAKSANLGVYVEYARSVAPSGAVILQVDANPGALASCSGASSPQFCWVSYGATKLTGGSHTITATIASDVNYNGASKTGTLTVSKFTPTMQVSLISIIYGTKATTLYASIGYPSTVGIAAPSGGVTLQVDSGAVLTPTCLAGSFPLFCWIIFSTPSLPGGSHTISGSVAADVNYNAASGTSTLTVTQAPPIMSVSPVSISYGRASATLGAYVSYGGAMAPTGGVSLKVDSGASLTASCAGAFSPLHCAVSYGTGTLTAGSHTIMATVAADANYSALSKTGTLKVTQASPILWFRRSRSATGPRRPRWPPTLNTPAPWRRPAG